MSEMALQLIRQAKAEGWKRLDLGRTGIVGEVPAEIWELEELEELILSNQWEEWHEREDLEPLKTQSRNNGLRNEISTFPAHPPKPLATSAAERIAIRFYHLPRLRKLVLAGMQVTDIQTFAQLMQLTHLDLSETQVADLQPLTQLRQLNHLYLYDTKAADLQPLTQLRQLTHLDLSYTKVADIQPLAQLQQLTHLYLYSTRVADIQPLAQLQQLTHLDLSFTKVADIQPLAQLQLLTNLKLSFTKVANILPLPQLLLLTHLNLCGTKVIDIQPLAQLRLLTLLDLSRTKVADIQPLAQLHQITELNLYSTSVADIQPLQSLIKKRLEVKSKGLFWEEGINIQNCPLTNPPYEIAKKGNEAILAYWAEQDRIGSDPLQEIKLFLLGNSTAGKSTLREALIQGEYDDTLSSTHGAELARVWQDGETRVNIWDFGGQEYFHATYRLLMNDRAVYALLIDPKHDEDRWHATPVRYPGSGAPVWEDLEHFHHRYWLETIRRHAPSSKVHVVWNKLDLEGRDKGSLHDADRRGFEAGQLEEHGLSLRGALLDKTPKWKRSWEDFHEALQEHIRARLQGERVLKYWPAVRAAVETQSISALSISRAEFDALVLADDPERNVELCILYLRDICGSILYWGDHNLLKDRVFINPNRLNDLIYGVLSPEVKRNGGQFTRERVRGVVEEAQGKADPDLADALIAVMQEFRIIFAVKGQAHTYVAPQYLPLPVPALLQAAREAMGILDTPRLVLRFDDAYIPRHVFPVFLTEAGPLATLEECWKTAVLFGVGEARVMVEVDHSARSITLRTDGSPQASPALLRIVLHSLSEAIGQGISFSICTDPVAVPPVWLPYRRLCDAARIGADFVADQDERHHPIAPWLEWLMDVAPQEGPRGRQRPVDGREKEAIERLTGEMYVVNQKVDTLLTYAAKSEQNEAALLVHAAQTRQENAALLAALKTLLARSLPTADPATQDALHRLAAQNSQLRDQLMALLQRLDDKADAQLQALDGLQDLLTAMDEAITTGLPALAADLQDALQAQQPQPGASPLSRFKVNLVKLLAVSAATQAGPEALPLLALADGGTLEATGSELKGFVERLIARIRSKPPR